MRHATARAAVLLLSGVLAAGLAVHGDAGARGRSGDDGARVVREREVVPSGSGGITSAAAFDPIVATHPTDPDRVAVSYHHWMGTSDDCGAPPTLAAGVRISHDGGRTWREARGVPWAGSGRVPNWHATIAWGPGPKGSARLYWADTTMGCDGDGHRLSIAWSDDEGETWSPLTVLRDVPATPAGGYPDITVDRDPKSPNHGVVYAAINWAPNKGTEPGFRVIASRDFGRSWDGVEVPRLPELDGYRFAYRIGYRLRPAPDGGLYVVFHQSDATKPAYGGYGRLGFGFTRLRYDRRQRSFEVRRPQLISTGQRNPVTLGWSPAPGSTDPARLRPRWTVGLDVDPASGRVYLALADYDLTPRPGRPRGHVKVGRSDDAGLTWRWTRLPALPAVDGWLQSAHKPSLAVVDGHVVVGVHGIADVPLGTSPRRGLATIGTAFSISHDGGETFSRPRPVTRARWDLEALAGQRPRAGLRDRMEPTAGGRAAWAYADGRTAGSSGARSRIRLAVIDPGRSPVTIRYWEPLHMPAVCCLPRAW